MKQTTEFVAKRKSVLGFALGVTAVAALTFSALSSATATPSMGKGFKKYGCYDVCTDRLFYCLSRGTNSNTCYYNYTLCTSGCNGGARVGSSETAEPTP